MADDKHYVPGDFYRICDRTGFKVRAGKTRQQWNNLIVRLKSWETRQPQDFVRGVRDDQFVPMPRPRQVNVFLGPLLTTVSIAAAIGATTLHVATSVRMQLGDKLNVMQNNGVNLTTFIQSIPNDTTITILPALNSAAAVGNYVVDLSAVAVADIND